MSYSQTVGVVVKPSHKGLTIVSLVAQSQTRISKANKGRDSRRRIRWCATVCEDTGDRGNYRRQKGTAFKEGHFESQAFWNCIDARGPKAERNLMILVQDSGYLLKSGQFYSVDRRQDESPV